MHRIAVQLELIDALQMMKNTVRESMNKSSKDHERCSVKSLREKFS